MGSDLHVIVVGGSEALVTSARDRIEELESRWSRFRPGSELCALNRLSGRPVRVSPDTVLAVRTAVDGWATTDGAYDPTILPALMAAGYDRDFESLDPDASLVATGSPPAAIGCAGIVIDPLLPAVTLPEGTALDFGGVGKGLAADLVATMLVERGARGACVNVGGDLRVLGESPAEDGWIIGLEHGPGVLLALADGAVATSATTRRRWVQGGVERHHLIDPHTGAPVASGLQSVTVISDSAAHAEVLTKAAFVAGAEGAPAVIAASGATGLLGTDAGLSVSLPGLEAFLR